MGPHAGAVVLYPQGRPVPHPTGVILSEDGDSEVESRWVGAVDGDEKGEDGDGTNGRSLKHGNLTGCVDTELPG